MKKKTPQKFLFDKRSIQFFATEEFVAIIDAMRGNVERTPWIRSIVQKFLDSDVRSMDHPDFPDYQMPENEPKIHLTFEMSGEMNRQIVARRWELEQDPEARRATRLGRGKTHIEPSMRTARFIKLAVIWYINRKAKRAADARESSIAEAGLASLRQKSVSARSVKTPLMSFANPLP